MSSSEVDVLCRGQELVPASSHAVSTGIGGTKILLSGEMIEDCARAYHYCSQEVYKYRAQRVNIIW